MQVNEQLIELELKARSFDYAVRAVSNLYAEAKGRQLKALGSIPMEWDRYTAASNECFALASALGCLGVTDLPKPKSNDTAS